MKTEILIAMSVACALTTAFAADPEPGATPESSPSIGARLLTHRWTVEEKEKSPIDDSPTVVFALVGTLNDGPDPIEFPMLTLVWKERHWSVCLNATGGYLGYYSPPLLLRWDQNHAENVTWDSASNHKAAFAPAPKKFILRAMKTSRLVVRAFPKFEGERTATFDMVGLADKMAKYPELMKSLGIAHNTAAK